MVIVIGSLCVKTVRECEHARDSKVSTDWLYHLHHHQDSL